MEENTKKQLLEKAELLKTILISRAQFKHQEDDEETYKQLRAELLSKPSTAAGLPNFVRTSRTLSEFWDFIKSRDLPTYQSRRVFLTEQFSSLLGGLEITAEMNSTVSERWDVFISHANEDKTTVARPLAAILRDRGLTVWIDENELRLGDSLRAKIDAGLAGSRYGIVILSESFFAKHWPQQELNGLFARESDGAKGILPVWHEVDEQFVSRFSPVLADRLAVRTSQGLSNVADEVLRAVRSERRGEAKYGGPPEVKRSSPIPELSEAARELLAEACRDPNGAIMRIQTMDGSSVQTNGRQFVADGSARTSARWRGAVDELCQRRLIEDRKGRGEVFFLTGEGYRVADRL